MLKSSLHAFYIIVSLIGLKNFFVLGWPEISCIDQAGLKFVRILFPCFSVRSLDVFSGSFVCFPMHLLTPPPTANVAILVCLVGSLEWVAEPNLLGLLGLDLCLKLPVLFLENHFVLEIGTWVA